MQMLHTFGLMASAELDVLAPRLDFLAAAFAAEEDMAGMTQVWEVEVSVHTESNRIRKNCASHAYVCACAYDWDTFHELNGQIVRNGSGHY